MSTETQNSEYCIDALKLQNESLRRDLDVMLISIMPQQKRMIKTYLWLTSLLGAGGTTVFIDTIEYGRWVIPMMVIFFFFACCVIYTVHLLLGAASEKHDYVLPCNIPNQTVSENEQYTQQLLITIQKTKSAIKKNTSNIALGANRLLNAERYLRISIFMIVILCAVAIPSNFYDEDGYIQHKVSPNARPDKEH